MAFKWGIKIFSIASSWEWIRHQQESVQYNMRVLTVSPGVSGTDFLSENPGFWPNLVQMVSISLKVTTIQIEPQMVPLGATRGRSFFYYMKIEGSKPAIYE